MGGRTTLCVLACELCCLWLACIFLCMVASVLVIFVSFVLVCPRVLQ